MASYTYDAFGNTLAQTGALATTFNHRFSTKYYDNESCLYYYGYRFYSPSIGRWLNRDPIEEDGGINLYAFCGNDGIDKFDKLGNDIYLVTGNNSGRWLNDVLHQSICVDTWTSCCPPKKSGRTCFSFGFSGEMIGSLGSWTWLGKFSPTLPGYWMKGVIYETDFVGSITKRKQTKCSQDVAWLKYMRDVRLNQTDVYSALRHNCRNFSQYEFENAPSAK